MQWKDVGMPDYRFKHGTLRYRYLVRNLFPDPGPFFGGRSTALLGFSMVYQRVRFSEICSQKLHESASLDKSTQYSMS